MRLGFPQDWNAMRTGVADWIRTAVPTGTLWGWSEDSKRPQMPRPYASIEFLSTPLARGSSGVLERLGAARVTIAVAQTYTLSLASGDVLFVAGGGDTVTTIRDAFVGLIAGSTAVGTDIIVLPSTETLLSVDPEPDLREKCGIRHRRYAQATLQVDAYANEKVGAQQLAGELRSGLEHEVHREILRAAGWGVLDVTAVRDIPELENGEWIGRSGFDVILGCDELSLEIQDIIDVVSLTRTVLSTDPASTTITPP